MKYTLLQDVVELLREFENKNQNYNTDIQGFKQWIADGQEKKIVNPDWEGKEKGRTVESAINTLFVHLNKYAKSYAKSAIYDSEFSTPEDFIYLITLKSFGAMTKQELIKKNAQDKPTGIQIINRGIAKGWMLQQNSTTDLRSKLISITPHGLEVLEKQMGKIRDATKIVAGNLTHPEKMQLIALLNKLERFHKPIYMENIDSESLLDQVKLNYLNYA